jgi:hypothetical protein
MSRRHHGRSRHHGRPRAEAAPPAGGAPTASPPPTSVDAPPPVAQAVVRPPTERSPDVVPAPRSNGAPHGAPGRPVIEAAPANGCTAPQLRRFIKSRPYVPMHELRRRFGIDGNDDDVTQVRMDGGAIYVGLPQREGTLLGELLRGGEIGFELSLDPRTPIVVGVYPMRPVPRS